MKNKELHLIGKNQFELRESEKIFNVEADEVLIRIKACGVCGSDLTYTQVSNHSIQDSIILGHEFTGFIEEIGKNVTHLKEGDRITVDAAVNCGECEYCLTGNKNLCENTKFYGYPNYDGGFQERIVIPAKVCYKMSNNIDYVNGTLIEPLAVCLHSLNLSKFKIGMNVAIIGAGPIGLIMVKILRRTGANKIFVSEPQEARRNMAYKFGADIVVNPYENDFESIVKEQTNNKGVEFVFEASGAQDGMELITKLVKPGGKLIMIGMPQGDNFNISHSEARKKGITILMVRRLKNAMNLAMQILEQEMDISELITHKFYIDEFLDNYQDILNYNNGIIKAVMVM